MFYNYFIVLIVFVHIKLLKRSAKHARIHGRFCLT